MKNSVNMSSSNSSISSSISNKSSSMDSIHSKITPLSINEPNVEVPTPIIQNNIQKEKSNELLKENKLVDLDLPMKSNKTVKEIDKKKDKKPKEEVVSILKLFRFVDWIDIILILIGTIAALGSAGIYPLMFLMYGQVAGTFVDINRNKTQILNTTISTINSTLNKCLQPSSNSNYDNRIETSILNYVIIGFVSLALNYLSHVCWNTSSERQIKKMRSKLYESIIRQDMSFFDKSTAGELNSIINSNVDTVKFGISFKFADFISLLGRGLGCVIFAMVSAWKFSIVFLALIPFIILSTTFMVIMIRKYTIEEFKAYGGAGRIAQEMLSSIRTVLALGLERKAVKNYSDNLNQAELMAKKKGFFSGLFAGLSSCLMNICFGIGIYYGVYLNRTECENFNAGVIIQSFFCIITTSFAVGQALPFLKDLAEARGAARKVFDIIDTKSLIDVFESKGVKMNNLKGDIEFENVIFSYPQRQNIKILHGLNFKIPAGKTVALVGSSGGGKSTVVSLLQRFYLPSSGTIRIDDNKIEDLDLNWLRSQMALVSQEPILFTSSIKENIRLGRLDATDAEIEDAAKNANAHNFIMTTTNQYDTQVGERGTQLSGGQKQRIAIARALIRNPKILLLDEATSALDYESEKIVQEALDKAKIGRTTIIIAHRLSTIRNADIIIYISNGKLVEKGTHDELIKLEGEYFKLVKAQTKNQHQSHSDDNKQDENKLNDSFKSNSSESEEEIEEKKELKSIETKNVQVTRPESSKNKNKIKKERTKPFYYEKKLFKFHKPETFWLIIGCLSQAINSALFPGTALIFSEIYNVFSIKDPKSQEIESLKYMGIIFGIGISYLIVNILGSYSFSLSGARVVRRIRIKMFESMLRQEIAYHDLDENRSSILATQLSSTAAFIKGISSDKLSLYSQGIAGVGVSLIVGFVLSWKLTLIMLIFVPITFLSGVIVGRASVNSKVKGKLVNEEGGRMTIETVENIKTIISLGRENYFIKEFNSVYNHKFKKTLLLFHVQAFFYSLSNSILFFVQASAFSFGYYLIKNNELEVTNLYRVYASLTFSSMILGRIYSQLPDQNMSKNAAKTAFKIIDRVSKIDSFSEDGLKPDKVIGNIKFENVYFNYPNRPNVKILNGLNLEIKNGETNALVGQSGCGKSTTIALLLRFYDSDSGTVYLDGIDIKKLNVHWLRTHIGLVSQEPILFNLTIYENICLGDLNREKIEMNEVIDTALKANIHNKIETLPDKYNTIVGSKGGQLSGGEKQRVAIARALIRQPKILLLDEATSALDNNSEHIVQDALDKAQSGRTCIVIAHRLSTIQNSHKITVFKEGVVLEEGTHSKLMENKNFYYKLQNQSQKKT